MDRLEFKTSDEARAFLSSGCSELLTKCSSITVEETINGVFILVGHSRGRSSALREIGGHITFRPRVSFNMV